MPATPVGAPDLERRLQALAADGTDPAAGLFGPHSMTWRVDREAAIFLGAGRALLLQLAHPWVAAAILEHSRTLRDPIGRLHRTFDVMFTLAFGTRDEAFAAARRLHRLHGSVRGALPQAAGPRHAAGSTYRADELAVLVWVEATLIETALKMHDLVLVPLQATERARYYDECRRHAGLFGIPPQAMPADWHAFGAYNARMWASDELAVNDATRRLAEQLLTGAGSRLRVPRWYRALTAHLLPPRLREAFGLDYGRAERRTAERAIGWARRLYPWLPARLRHVGPYQEAVGRLAGRPRPDALTRQLNRLWIGRTSIGGARG